MVGQDKLISTAEEQTTIFNKLADAQVTQTDTLAAIQATLAAQTETLANQSQMLANQTAILARLAERQCVGHSLSSSSDATQGE